MANNNPSAKAGETNIAAARMEAAAKLLPLFGGKDAKGEEVPGAFHTHGIPRKGQEYPSDSPWANPQYREFVFSLQDNQHARDLATVMSAHGNPNLPPALTTEFLGGKEDSRKWFADTFLGGLAEVFRATCTPGQLDGRGLFLNPNRAGIDHAGAAYSILTRKEVYVQFNLKFVDEMDVEEEVPRTVFPGDLLGMAAFVPPQRRQQPELSPVQRLYRWAKRDRQEAPAKRERGDIAPTAEDPAAALPQAAAPPEPAPAPVAGPVILHLTALLGDRPAKAPPAAPTGTSRRKAAAVPTAAAPVVSQPAPLAAATPQLVSAQLATQAEEEPKAPNGSQDPNFVAALLDEGSPKAKAMAYMLRRERKTLAEAVTLAKAEGILE